MNEYFEETYTLRTTDVDMHERLRTSRLLEILQELAGDHVDTFGFGRSYTLPLGIAWIVVRQHIEFERVPKNGETLCLRTWPGRIMHAICPRYFLITDNEGHPLIRACFVWVLLDLEKRIMVSPAKYGIAIDPGQPGALMPLPKAPAPLPALRQFGFTVPYSYVDVNRHMNNARYLDMAEDAIDAPKAGRKLRDLLVEFTSELLPDETMQVTVGQEGDAYSIHGEKDGKEIIKIRLTYR